MKRKKKDNGSHFIIGVSSGDKVYTMFKLKLLQRKNKLLKESLTYYKKI